VITLLLLIARAKYISLAVCSKSFSRNLILGARSFKFSVTLVTRNFVILNDVGPVVSSELFSQNMAKIQLEFYCPGMLGRFESLQKIPFFSVEFMVLGK
jgi:hypothetical protein